MMKPAITIYTDGACRGNPGDGGWGALLISGANEKSICGGEKDTTNNRMELLAVIKALEIIKQTSEIKIYTDSTYVQKGITEWIHTWKRNHWKNSSKKIFKNIDLWQRLDELASGHVIEWLWVKGHAGHDGNEKADQLANQGVDNLLKGL